MKAKMKINFYFVNQEYHLEDSHLKQISFFASYSPQIISNMINLDIIEIKPKMKIYFFSTFIFNRI